jgi:hypothetical protein
MSLIGTMWTRRCVDAGKLGPAWEQSATSSDSANILDGITVGAWVSVRATPLRWATWDVCPFRESVGLGCRPDAFAIARRAGFRHSDVISRPGWMESQVLWEVPIAVPCNQLRRHDVFVGVPENGPAMRANWAGFAEFGLDFVR